MGTELTSWGTMKSALNKEATISHNSNKKVLLRERKSHTACRVASARFADGGGGGQYPLQSCMGEGTPSSLGWGGGTPCPDLGWGTPHVRTWDAVHPRPDLGWVPLVQIWDGVPPPPASVDRLKILPFVLRMRAVSFFRVIFVVTVIYELIFLFSALCNVRLFVCLIVA